MEIHGVIFDLYGTLVPFSPNAYARLVGGIGDTLGLPKSHFIHEWANAWSDLEKGKFSSTEAFVVHVAKTLGLRIKPGEAHRMAERHRRFQRKTLRPAVHVASTLRRLRDRGLKVGVVTNCPPETPALWTRFKVKNLISVAVFSCVERVSKPSSEIYQRCLRRMKCRPDACVFVGDGGNDELAGAAAIGLRPIWLRPKRTFSPAKVVPQGGATIQRIDEVLRFCPTLRDHRICDVPLVGRHLKGHEQQKIVCRTTPPR